MAEIVLVVLGYAAHPDTPVPATITQWPKQRKAPSYVYLTADQKEAMGKNQTAFWHAEWLDYEKRWSLGEIIPDEVPASVIREWQRQPVVLDEAELPF